MRDAIKKFKQSIIKLTTFKENTEGKIKLKSFVKQWLEKTPYNMSLIIKTRLTDRILFDEFVTKLGQDNNIEENLAKHLQELRKAFDEALQKTGITDKPLILELSMILGDRIQEKIKVDVKIAYVPNLDDIIRKNFTKIKSIKDAVDQIANNSKDNSEYKSNIINNLNDLQSELSISCEHFLFYYLKTQLRKTITKLWKNLFEDLSSALESHAADKNYKHKKDIDFINAFCKAAKILMNKIQKQKDPSSRDKAIEHYMFNEYFNSCVADEIVGLYQNLKNGSDFDYQNIKMYIENILTIIKYEASYKHLKSHIQSFLSEHITINSSGLKPLMVNKLCQIIYEIAKKNGHDNLIPQDFVPPNPQVSVSPEVQKDLRSKEQKGKQENGAMFNFFCSFVNNKWKLLSFASIVAVTLDWYFECGAINCIINLFSFKLNPTDHFNLLA